MKKILFITLLGILPLLVMSQAVITFEKSIHDFGTIKEEGGRVSYDFTFKNEGNTALVISSVRASCGCTSPSWTKSPVEPGGKGKITVSYNPTGRPGGFNKSVTVQSNATVETERLYIKGSVTPKPKVDPVTQKYPINIKGLLLNTKSIEFGDINKGSAKEQSINISNNTEENIVISFANMPGHITLSAASNTTIQPKTEGTITFLFDTKKHAKWGPVSEDFYLLVNNNTETSEENKLTIKANIVEDFSNMTLAEKRTAPILEIAKRTVLVGTLGQGEVKQGSIAIKNVGEKPLAIRKIINNNPEITFEATELSVKSGKTINSKFTVNTTGLSAGKHTRAITLQTNDPENALVVIGIEWEVK